MLKVISANRLADGIVVYAGRGGAWFERLNDARLFVGQDEAEAGLILAEGDAARNLIVDPFLVDVTQDSSGLRPASLRETIRAQGPTIDFLVHQRAHNSGTIPAPKNSESQAGQIVACAAQPKTLRSFGHKPRRAQPAADLVEGIAP